MSDCGTRVSSLSRPLSLKFSTVDRGLVICIDFGLEEGLKLWDIRQMWFWMVQETQTGIPAMRPKLV